MRFGHLPFLPSATSALPWLLCFVGACGGGSPAAPSAHEGSGAQPESEGAASDPVPVFDLHEWGVVAVRDGSFAPRELFLARVRP